jgi:hypothetical protein
MALIVYLKYIGFETKYKTLFKRQSEIYYKKYFENLKIEIAKNIN